MTHAELAKRIRQSIYERSDMEGGAISREQMDNAIEGALSRFAPSNSWVERPAPGVAAALSSQDGLKSLLLDWMAADYRID